MSDGLTIRFWGTRGSIPTPGRSTEKYGGNTPCIEVRHRDTRIVVDAGSGIREMSTKWLDEEGVGPTNVSLLFTHLHWDHIQGFPFFAHGYMSQNELVVFGEADKPVEELLSGQMSGDYFPVELSAMRAKMVFRPIVGPFEVGGVHVTPFPLPHPGGSLGFRMQAGDSVLVVATDSELDLIAQNRDEVLEDHEASRSYADDFLEMFRGANLVVLDCQYTDSIYAQRTGWGHNSVATAVDLCRQTRPDMVALYHHDPQSSDDTVSNMADEVNRRLAQTKDRILVFAAREGLAMRVAKPKPPPALIKD